LAIRQITAPVDEPLDLAEVKRHLRVEIDDDDDYIQALIAAAREYCEEYTHRAFLTQTWQLLLDHFPGVAEHNQGYTDLGVMGDAALGIGIPPVGYTYRYQSEVYFRAGAIIVPKPPLLSIDFIEYIDTDGVLRTLDASQYQVDTSSEPARIAPAPNSNWPLTQISIRAPMLNTVTIQFQCGYGADPTEVPNTIRAAMKLLIAHWYDNRSEVIAGTRLVAVQIPIGAESLLWTRKVVTFP
jgi:uncharacterized phiE125 gp8 family phage protein